MSNQSNSEIFSDTMTITVFAFFVFSLGLCAGSLITERLNDTKWKQKLIEKKLGHYTICNPTNGETEFVLIENSNSENKTNYLKTIIPDLPENYSNSSRNQLNLIK